MEQDTSYFAIIPANVRYDKTLTSNHKVLYAEITALTRKEGFCWASNKHFAEMFDVEKETISRWIALLEKKGYLRTTLEYKENSKEIAQRRIYLQETATLLIPKSIPIDSTVNTPIDSRIKDNKINKNEDKRETPTPQFSTSVRNLDVDLPSSNFDKSEATAIFEQTFNIPAGNFTANVIDETVTNLDHWKQFLLTKRTYGDKPIHQRRNIPNWIFNAYDEYTASHPIPRKLSEEQQRVKDEYEQYYADRREEEKLKNQPRKPLDESWQRVFADIKQKLGGGATVG